MDKVRLEILNTASTQDFAAALAHVFEHSPWVAEGAATGRPYATLVELRRGLLSVIKKASRDQRLVLIRSHPDLANKTQRAVGLTVDSVSEQDGAGLDRLSEAEFGMFDAANTAYKAKFGFPFIICARRHTKDSILDVFQQRLMNTAEAEERAALDEIARIATLRLAQTVDAADTLAVYGHLSTHVLDSHAGRPAAGVEFQLVELSRHGAERVLIMAAMNADGRTDQPLIHGRPVPVGSYELRFSTASYYVRHGVTLADPPFLDTIAIRFSIAEPEARYHIPLLMTPWSYSTYRGS